MIRKYSSKTTCRHYAAGGFRSQSLFQLLLANTVDTGMDCLHISFYYTGFIPEPLYKSLLNSSKRYSFCCFNHCAQCDHIQRPGIPHISRNIVQRDREDLHILAVDWLVT